LTSSRKEMSNEEKPNTYIKQVDKKKTRLPVQVLQNKNILIHV